MSLTKMMPDQTLLPLILVLILHFSVSIVHCQDRPCYLTGKVALPKDVIPPADVKCVAGNILGKIPNLEVASKKFSDIDFSKAGTTPGGFALAQFTAGGNNNADTLGVVGKLYTAANAALRDRGDKKILVKLKVVDFFIASQLDTVNNNPKGVVRNLKKTIKNCEKSCNKADCDKLISMFTAAGGKPETLEGCSQPKRSKA
ncbi:hypothetical protein Pst134EA_022834 [Puccinia striiformis f. sp. tritici]|uniref:hypothetical protein n=1 Tax=Puccinia striiformis f. sp. tritici TaxID=168172 RepID=UPI002007DE65|nr:hypothetical protein Pst134EA_022834 [Puccinia striiformis f. sp. tritici]KAH9455364.1 hypothetical protein Pst134EA_022834 [Puccinia striiformis f. sp. tritici]KAI9605965.1 hypothetical protein H4Q26_004336 [Puccinia striiformis f. sp. tritici PST-130]